MVQSQIVSRYRRLGATVTPIHIAFGGLVCVIIGYMGIKDIVEIDDKNPPGTHKLTKDELVLREIWGNSIRFIESIDDVSSHLREIKNKSGQKTRV